MYSAGQRFLFLTSDRLRRRWERMNGFFCFGAVSSRSDHLHGAVTGLGVDVEGCLERWFH